MAHIARRFTVMDAEHLIHRHFDDISAAIQFAFIAGDRMGIPYFVIDKTTKRIVRAFI